MSEKERTETWRDDSIPLDKEISRDGLITESHEPESKDAYRHGYHYHREHSDHHSGESEHHHSEHSHHHSEHHHHKHRRHHRHRSRSRKNNRNKKSIKQILVKNKKHILYTALAVLFFIFAVFAGVYFDRIVGDVVKQTNTGSAQQNTDGNLVVSVPVFDEDVSLIGSAAQAYLTDDTGATAHDIFTRYKGKEYRLDVGAPVTLNYEIKGCPQGYIVEKAEFLVSENADFDNAITLTAEGTAKEAVFYNLKTGTQYAYRINIHFANGVVSTVGGQFRTAIGPRMMKVDGVYNMRDIGGWVTADGQMVRQGLLYRGCELDGSVEDRYTITKAGIDTLINELGIKTDMDLRLDSENPLNIDILGGNIKHVHYGAPLYTHIFRNTDGQQETIRLIFADLADKNNYPVYLHCTYGQDRTGTVCYLLSALLGVPQESLIKDYELSALHHGYVEDAKMEEFVERINQLPGATLSEKVEGYLLTIGVTEQEISNIRNIFLDN